MLTIDESIEILQAHGFKLERLVKQNKWRFLGIKNHKSYYTKDLIDAAERVQLKVIEILENA